MSSAAGAQSTKASGPRSVKGARTRARLLEAAKEIFEEQGFLDARISDISERAGLSHGSFYHYFESKEQAFREVAEAVDARLSAPLGDVVLGSPSKVSPRDRLREALRRHFEAYRAEARIMGVIEQVARYDDEVGALRLERHEQYRQQIASSIRQLQQRGLADPGLDPDIAASAVGALSHRFAELWLVQGGVECSIEEGADQVARLMANALGLAPSTG